MPKPSSTELMAARFYEAMLLIVAMRNIMPDAMRLAIDWSKESAAKEKDGSDADLWADIIGVIERRLDD